MPGFIVAAKMELVIAEKPSVGRDLARVLGATRRGDGCLEGPRHVVTWCVGHVVELEEPGAYEPGWKRWSLESLPMIPGRFALRGVRSSRAQLACVKKLLRDKRFDAVVNACDAGREGELIFRWAYEHAGARLPVRRLWISSLTDASIRAGFASLQPGARYDALADAARCRAEADWLVGMNCTRAYTLRQRSVSDALLSVGRVQTPTLALLTERERAIREFVPVDYWELLGQFRGDEGAPFKARWSSQGRSALAEESLAAALRARAEDAVRLEPAVVESLRARKQRVPPPLLFDLTSLQRAANGRFGMSAQRTLDVAQALYERHKLITYPRTDSRHLNADLFPTLAPIFEALASAAALRPFADALRESPPTRSPRVFDDKRVGDHHAILPTAKAPALDRLERDEARLYELIARRFLGVFFPDAEFALTTAVIRAGRDDGAREKVPDAPDPAKPQGDESEAPERFHTRLPPPPDRFIAHGRQCLARGWQEVAGFDAGGAAQVLPAMAEGQRLAARFATEAKRTQPPRRYNDASILAAMEGAGRALDDEALRDAMKDHGLGTPATRAATLETLLKRGYIARDKKSLCATPSGESLIASLPVESLRSPELTGQWEARLAAIARGQERRESFMRDINAFVTRVVDEFKSGALMAGSPAAKRGSAARAAP
ncbi:MAG: DNA topoisomerase, partial [Polyangiales bacterium]